MLDSCPARHILMAVPTTGPDGLDRDPSDAAGSQSTGPLQVRHHSGRRRSGLQLADVLSRNWLVLLLRGLIAISFGILVFLLFKKFLQVLVLPFGTYALTDGVLGVGVVLGERAGRGHWWVLLCWGLAGVAVGILTFFISPGSALEFMVYIAIWAVATGVLEVMTAVHLRRRLGAEWLLILTGLISVIFGVSIVVLSGVGAFLLARMIAAYAIGFGVMLGTWALRARAARLPSA